MPVEPTGGGDAFCCPKSMTYGPCGGVGPDGACEVDPRRCVFLDDPAPAWSAAPEVPRLHPGAARMRDLLDTRPIVVADLPAVPMSPGSITDCAEALGGRVDAVLAGDSGGQRVQFPPAYRALLGQQAGLTVWSGLNCRDRNRVALEGELAALADVGVGGVHCVTGDHTDLGHRPDAQPVFDLDSMRTTALARARGHLVSVAESPCAPPADRRPSRLLDKQRAGAGVCFVNHAGGAEAVRSFVARARDVGVTLDFLACVPVVIDEASLAVMRSFATSPMPAGYAERILAATDRRAAGVAAATEVAAEMLGLGIAGVNLSGGAGPGREAWFAEACGEVADRLGLVPR